MHTYNENDQRKQRRKEAEEVDCWPPEQKMRDDLAGLWLDGVEEEKQSRRRWDDVGST